MNSQNNRLTKIFVFFFLVCIATSQQPTQQQNSGTVDPQIVRSTNQQANVPSQPQVIITNQNPTGSPQLNQGTIPVSPDVGIDPIVVEPVPVQQANNQVPNPNTGSQAAPSADPVITVTVDPVNSNQGQPSQHQGQNYDEPNAERSARYRAQQQRINQIRKRYQQQNEARLAQEREKQQIKLTKTQQMRTKQKNQFRNVISEQPIGVAKKTVLFEVDHRINELILYPISNVEVYLKMTVYVLENNAYGVVRDITTSGTVKAYVYEDSARIVAEGAFYFEKALKFKAKAKSIYTIRFYNEGTSKLVSFTYPNFLEETHVENLYSNERKHLHLWKTEILGMRISEITDRLRRNSLMDKVNNETMMDFLKKYSGYQFVQMLLVILVTGFQVHLIKKMFKSDSIL